MRAIIYSYTPGQRLCGKRVIALGYFDGVHKGHREILKRAAAEAKALGAAASVFTFTSVSDSFKGSGRIYSNESKISLISECGIDDIIIADFEAVKSISAEDFISKTLIADLGCILAVSGKDFRFGEGARGNTELLKERIEKFGAGLICPSDVVADGEKISSSKIKELLSLGNVKKAGELLGAPYFVKSKVVRGLGIGKSFGFPTVNTEIEKGTVSLPCGVYKCVCQIDKKSFHALTNVGTCPTVSNREKHMETYIIGCEEDLYDREIKICFLDFLRSEKKFETKEALIMQIKDDIFAAFGNKE